jgi:predicted membrane-bound mannosyltransferase
MKDRFEQKSVLLLVINAEAERAKARKEVFMGAVVLVCAVVLACVFFYGACNWARGLWKTGTELPVAPYSMDEATGEVMK